jgi:hypothetical protein
VPFEEKHDLARRGDIDLVCRSVGLVAIEPADNILSAIQEQLPMTSKLLRLVPMIVSLSIPALAADPPAPAAPADPHHEAKDAKKKDKKDKKDEKDEKKVEEKKDEKK